MHVVVVEVKQAPAAVKVLVKVIDGVVTVVEEAESTVTRIELSFPDIS